MPDLGSDDDYVAGAEVLFAFCGLVDGRARFDADDLVEDVVVRLNGPLVDDPVYVNVRPILGTPPSRRQRIDAGLRHAQDFTTNAQVRACVDDQGLGPYLRNRTWPGGQAHEEGQWQGDA